MQSRTESERLLDQAVILENPILTSPHGVGKTVLLDTFRPLAIRNGWRWVDIGPSHFASLTEQALAIRLLTNLSGATSTLSSSDVLFDYDTLVRVFESTPGFVADKLKEVLETVAAACRRDGIRGVVFAYDQAQTLVDSPADGHFPLSLLLDVFQSIQKRDIPFMLALSGQPALFLKLVEARTFAERMFRVIDLDASQRQHGAAELSAGARAGG